MEPKLPLDIILSIAEFLDVEDLIFFRLINRAVYDQIEVNLSIWRRLAWDAVQLFPRAPHTFDISSMSAAEAKALALRPYRFEHLLLHPRDDHSEVEISMSPLAPESVHRLKKPEGSYFNMWYTLPGNRWLYAILGLENNDYQLSLWDLHSPIKAEGTEPVCSVQIKQPHQPILFPPKAYPQLDKDHDAVNFLIYYGTM
ncbi:hypothetical protein DL93DRAFT_276439 [Clavulina sp. PMI_390]|nr:hypothetical protein DL93DRAFT_276439 [Clavulina sp. PMI_390]